MKNQHSQTTNVHTLEDALQAALDRVEAHSAAERLPLALSTGFEDLDALTSGLHGGTLTVLASRPAMGRSTLLLNICRTAAITNRVPTLHVSLEHSVSETTLRTMSAECRVALHHLRAGTINEADSERLNRRLPQVANAPLYYWAPPYLTAAALADRVRTEVETRDVRLVAVDGVQDIRPEQRNDLREREVGDVIRDLKALSRELDIPIVCTSHLNRAPEQRDGRVPALDDLRESGAITFAADTIVLLYREDAYEKESARAGEADLIVAKHRNGPTAIMTVAFQGHYSRFVDMAQN
ncbi:replicative DNA helicase [Streptomyces tendae]|uniref:replicative DNA helicase n=1 Tax=Streptomyces tendae TaxID=1932 RepID=UPI003D718005